jgi:release factor glutamine methyltransferase
MTGPGDLPATIDATLRRTAATFRAAGLDTPGLDARLLLGAALGLDTISMLREPGRALTPAEVAKLEELVARRLRREPVSRIIGKRWFHGLDFEIDPATLDPRPETETLVEGVLTRLRESGREAAPVRILDLGTGSGAILVALLVALPSATGLGTDISPAALAMARRNASRHGVIDRADFRNADWFTGVELEQFDIIVSNPPYIASGELAALETEVALYDPPAALDGGLDGLLAYRTLISAVPALLAPAGLLVLEVGAGQHQEVAQLCADAGLVPEPASSLWLDLSGHVRCVAATPRFDPNAKKTLGIGGQSS